MANDVRSKVVLGLDVNEFRRGITQVDSSIKGISKQFQNLGGLIGASFAVGKVIQFGKEAVQMASEFEQVAQGFKRFGSEAELKGLRQATRGLVTDLELMKVTVQAGNFGIPIEEMGKLLSFAARRAAETGQSVDYLVNSIITGIGRKSPLILDNLGISTTRLKEKFQGAAIEAQSIADVARAVGDIATEELGKMGEPIDTAAEKLQRLSTAWDNFKTAIGAPIADEVANFLEKLSLTLLPSEQGGGLSQGIRARTGNTGAAGKIKPRPAVVPSTEPIVPVIPPTTLASLNESVKLLREQYEAAAVGSREFYNLRTQIEKAEQRIKDLTEGVVPQTQALQVNAKTTNDVYQAQEKSLRIMRQLPDAGMAYAESLRIISDAQEQLDRQLQAATAIANQFGYILETAFSAAVVDGQDFFEKMREGIKAYIQQMIAATAATLALAGALSIIFPQIGFKALFNAVGGGTGLPFGFDDNSGQFGLRIAGNDFYTGMERNNRRNARTGG